MIRSCLAILCCALLVGAFAVACPRPAQDASAQNVDNGSSARPPRGKKLILKDGSYHVVRSYQRNGERVRYYSVERSAWEELPAALVDWDATAKDDAKQAQAAADLASKIRAEDAARTARLITGIDASLLLAPGVFLPQEEGLYVLDGGKVTLLGQIETQASTDKKQFLKKILVPIPIVSDKQNLNIPGAHATLRLRAGQPEFFLREAPADPDRVSPIRKTNRPGVSPGPEVELIRATVKGNQRHVASIHSILGEEMGAESKTVSIQRLDLATHVFRFTLSEPLPPGEYVLAELTDDGINMYVWDFGVDASPPAPPKNPRAQPQPAQ